MPVNVELPQELQERVIDAQRILHDLLPFIDDVESCGVQCQAQRDLVSTLKATLAEVEQRFIKKRKKGK